MSNLLYPLPSKIKSHLIQLVREHDFLWDSSADNYRNLSLKDQTWAKIAQETGYRGTFCPFLLKRWALFLIRACSSFRRETVVEEYP